MDLSHLVTIGLMGAKRKPLTAADSDYFLKHQDIERVLCDIVEQLAAAKPADPLKFIADAAAKLSGGKAAAPVAAKSSPKQAPAASPKKAAAPAAAPAGEVDEAQIKAVGDEIRALKEKLKAEGFTGAKLNGHPDVKAAVEKLAALKAGGAAPAEPAKAAPKAKAEAKKDAGKKADKKPKGEDAVAKKEGPTKGGGMDCKKADDVPLWYEQVLQKSELIEQYPIKGCFILRPWAYAIWEQVMGWFDGNIKKLGVQNCYFPMFIPESYIARESKHLSDFAPELAMVTRCGNTEFEEPVAIRPTSETAMYAAYSNWVQSHRDLPIKLNQWCSVVRWEVKQTTPFIRTREFLWQEGHSAFATKEEAAKEVLDILDLYAGVYNHLMAVPCVKGTKTKAETFPGADYTTTVEVFIPPTGRAIQGATSHHLGQNFSKMFEIEFQDPTDPTGKKKEFAYQNSWGLSQRSISTLILIHGDDKGLVLPPRVAGHQVVIVPVGLKASSTEEDRKTVNAKCEEYQKKLTDAGLRVKLDVSDNSPGWKFNNWEMKGVPVRIEVGPMDIQKGEFIMAKRNIPDPKKSKVSGKDKSIVSDVQKVLDEIHDELYAAALAERDSCMASVDVWKDFSPQLNMGKMVLIPFCGDPDCEDMIKDKSKEEAQDAEVMGGLKMGAKSLCVPHEDKYNVKCPTKCINPDCPTKKKVERRTLFGRSY